MSREAINLTVFIASLIAGATLVALGHSDVGFGLIAFATGHVIPSPIPIPKTPENPTPSLERVEAEETSSATSSGLAGLLVFVNGAAVIAPRSPLTYEDVVEMAGLTGHPSVTFRRARDGRHGILHAGQAVDVVAGTALNAVHTVNA